MVSYVYGMGSDEIRFFLGTGVIDLSGVRQNIPDFSKYSELFICDVDKFELIGPFAMLYSQPSDYLMEGKMSSLQVICTMSAPVYHMDWDPMLVGELTDDDEMQIHQHIDEIDMSKYRPSVTGDYLLDGLLRNVLKKDSGRFIGYVLAFVRNSPLIEYLKERLSTIGINAEIHGNDIYLIDGFDDSILDKICPEEYAWNPQFVIGYLAQSIEKIRIRSYEGCPFEYTYHLILKEKPEDIYVIIDEKQSIFTDVDCYGRMFISPLCYNYEPLSLLFNSEKNEISTAVSFDDVAIKFRTSLYVLINIFTFNSINVSVIDFVVDTAMLQILTNGEIKTILVVDNICERTESYLREHSEFTIDIIVMVDRYNGISAPSWINGNDLRYTLDNRFAPVNELKYAPISGIDKAIVNGLADKFDIIWGHNKLI